MATPELSPGSTSDPSNGPYSFSADVAFTTLFLLATISTVVSLRQTRSWALAPLAVGGIFQVIGYASRIVSSDNAGSSVFILVAPLLFAASIFTTLNRVVDRAEGEAFFKVNPEWLTCLFLAGDVMSLFIQSGGSWLMTFDSLRAASQRIIVGGLALHTLGLGLFLITTAVFHQRVLGRAASRDLSKEKTVRMLYTVTSLAIIRSVAVVVDLMSHDGPLGGAEWSPYVFDAAPMLILMIVFCGWFPAVRSGNKPAWAPAGVTVSEYDTAPKVEKNCFTQ